MRSLENILQRKFYRRVQRPGRYSGGELNYAKPNSSAFHLALAFPDLYEIGFPYLGFQILYHLLNRIEGVSCQRVYAPAEDAEKILRQENIPLFTLEGKTPLSDLDLLGFTLQYELHSSNILNMLELGQIPLRSSDRDERFPLIIAGGTLAYHPEPFAPFFDAFLIGDGEIALSTVVRILKNLKVEGWKREEVLERIAQLPGVYIPKYYEPSYDQGQRFLNLKPSSPQTSVEIRAQHIEALDIENYPTRPLVPLISVEHNRLTIEIMRGCTRGCRFCNAGMINRPTREIPVSSALRYFRECLKFSGYEEASLLSLSTADYSALPELLQGLMDIQADNLTISFPSLRPDAFTAEIASAGFGGRKTSLTFAPEAGSERLRKIINKDLSDEDLFRALHISAEYGWQTVKLYFIIGLPGETEEDVEAIVDLVYCCRDILKPSSKKPLHISLAVFSPKPNTSFQRAGMLDLDLIWKRLNLVRRGLKGRQFKISFHDPQMAQVETLIARGDRRVSGVIEKVFRAGARFEGWSDRFDFRQWEEAMQEEGLEWERFLGELSEKSLLPWSHIKTGISDEYFIEEWRNSQNSIITPDCRSKCSQCGLECSPPPKSKPLKSPMVAIKKPPIPAMTYRWRFKYSRKGAVSFISHLENVKLLERAFRRARIPLAYSRGFHPHPQFSFGLPLPVGYEARADYFDAYLYEKGEDFGVKLNRIIPKGMRFLSDKEVTANEPSLFHSLNALAYEVHLLGEKPEKVSMRKLLELTDEEIRPHIIKLNFEGKLLSVIIRIISGKHLRPEKLLQLLEYNSWEARIIRVDCFHYSEEGVVYPL